MNAQAEALRKRTKNFALAVLAFVRTLPRSDEGRHIAYQLTKAGTSVGANYRACCRSRSAAEFIARVGVVLEEADEAAFWLEFIVEDRMSVTKEASALLDEANQLSAIMAQSRLTASRRLRDPPI